MTRSIHLTDLHLSHPDLNDPHLHSDTPGTLARVVAEINAMDPAPVFVVASGDLTNQGDALSYGLVKDLFAPLRVPVVLALGNHDKRAGFNEVFHGAASDMLCFHDRLLGGIHVITLDTGVPEHIAGAIGDAQFDYLGAALVRHADLPKLLVLHHPPRVDPDGLPWGSLDMASTERLAEVVAGHRIIGILSGHIHINRVSHWHGIPIIISNGLHSAVDLLETRDLKIVEGTGFGICVWWPSGLSVSFVSLSPAARELGIIDQDRLRAFT